MNDYHILSTIIKFGIETVKGIPSGKVNLSINKGFLTITWNSKTDPISFRIKLSTIKKHTLKMLGLNEHPIKQKK